MSKSEARAKARADKHTAKKKARRLKKAQRKAWQAAARKHPTPTKTKPLPVQMQKDPRKHITAQRDLIRDLERKLVNLKKLVQQYAPAEIAAAI